MTPKRKAALQWLHDQGETEPKALYAQVKGELGGMVRSRQLANVGKDGNYRFVLSEQGLRDLEGAR